MSVKWMFSLLSALRSLFHVKMRPLPSFRNISEDVTMDIHCLSLMTRDRKSQLTSLSCNLRQRRGRNERHPLVVISDIGETWPWTSLAYHSRPRSLRGRSCGCATCLTLAIEARIFRESLRAKDSILEQLKDQEMN